MGEKLKKIYSLFSYLLILNLMGIYCSNHSPAPLSQIDMQVTVEKNFRALATMGPAQDVLEVYGRVFFWGGGIGIARSIP